MAESTRLDRYVVGQPSAEDLRFIFRSGRLCLAFCATVGERWRRGFERLRTPADLGRWYVAAGVVAEQIEACETDLDLARTTREAIYRAAKALIDGRPPTVEDEDVINRAAAAPPPVPLLTRGTLSVRPADPAPAQSALSAVARDAIALFTATEASRVRECADAECGLLFLDLSRPGRRRWCSSTACGGKARAAAYRRRKDVTDTANRSEER